MTAQAEYDAHLAADDSRLAEMEADGVDRAGAEYATLWNDRMSYAHNCQPDVYVTEMADVEPEPEELQRLHSPMREPEPEGPYDAAEHGHVTEEIEVGGRAMAWAEVPEPEPEAEL